MLLGTNALISVTPGLMIWTIVLFLLTLWVLKRYAFGPIQKMIDERREQIRRSLEEADEARDEARSLLEEHRKLMQEARGEAEQILAEARRTRESMEQRMREETEADRQRRLEETRREIAAETARALAMSARCSSSIRCASSRARSASSIDWRIRSRRSSIVFWIGPNAYRLSTNSVIRKQTIVQIISPGVTWMSGFEASTESAFPRPGRTPGSSRAGRRTRPPR